VNEVRKKMCPDMYVGITMEVTMEVWKVVLPIGKGLEGKEVRPEFTHFILKREERYKLSKSWSDLFSSQLFC
jgi:hypothetical protein